MYKIGEFSKIVDIPVRTLRFYAEYGILLPSEVDDFTGYRYYNDENIIECELLKILKSLDFTLEEIIDYKDCMDNEMIIKKRKEIEEKICLLKLKYKRLTILEEEIKNKKEFMNKIKESLDEKVLSRKYEKRKIRKKI